MADYQDSDLLGDSGKVDAAPLDVDDDFFDVLKEVTPVAAKWKAVGLALRLKHGELDSIAASHPHNVEECLSEMLTQWMGRKYNVKRFGQPSWQRLVEAVGDPAGGANPSLANLISEKHRVEQTTELHPHNVREKGGGSGGITAPGKFDSGATVTAHSTLSTAEPITGGSPSDSASPSTTYQENTATNASTHPIIQGRGSGELSAAPYTGMSVNTAPSSLLPEDIAIGNSENVINASAPITPPVSSANTPEITPERETSPRVQKETLPELCNLLSPVMCSWDLFAQQIGVPSDQISLIKATTPQSGPTYFYLCFIQALEWWEANHDNPVYEIMIDALDPGIGKVTPVMNTALASELREFMAEQQGTAEPITGGSPSDSASPSTTYQENTATNASTHPIIQGRGSGEPSAAPYTGMSANTASHSLLPDDIAVGNSGNVITAPQPTANWQYQELSRKSADVAMSLAANKLAGILAGYLKAREIIGQPVYYQATNYAPGVTEYARVEHLITAVLTKTKYNPQCYHDFIQILELDGIRPDTEAARLCLPKAMPPTATTTSSPGRAAIIAEGNQPQKRNFAAEAFRRNSTALHDALAQPDVASGLATKLYNGAIITVETRDAVQMPSFTPTQQANWLLQAVESSIKINHTRLRKFTRVLKKQPVLEPIAKQLRQCYRELVSEARLTESLSSGSDTNSTEQHQSQAIKFPAAAAGTHTASSGLQGSQAAKFTYAREVSLPASETVSLSPKLTPGSISDTTSSFSYQNIENLSSHARVALESRLLKDSDIIMSMFGDLIHHTVNSIVSRVTVKELRIRLKCLEAYRPTRSPVPLLRDQMDEIERAEDVLSVFCILDKYYSFFNYGIIEKLISWFGTPEDKERLETYTESFKTFCKRRTFECPPDIFGHTIDKGKTDLVVKVEESWDPTPREGCSLENLRRLCNSLADILEVEPETLYLRQINKGCVELLFQVPSFVEEDIFPLSLEQERALTAVGVTRLTCGSYRFPQSPEVLLPQTSAQAETEVKQKCTAETITGGSPSDSASPSTTYQENTATDASTHPIIQGRGSGEPSAAPYTGMSVNTPPSSLLPEDIAVGNSENVIDASAPITPPVSSANTPEITPERETSGHSPTLRELDQLPGVGTIWYRLGLQLGVRADDLDMIEKNYPRDTDMCKIKMFAEWRRGDTNPTYEKLVRALAAVGKRKLAESVCRDRGISSSVLDATAATELHQSHEEMQLESAAVTAAKAEIEYLRDEYKQLVMMTQEAVKARSTTLTEFRTDITLQLPEPVRSEVKLNLTEQLPFIYDAKSIDAIFGIFNLNIWSYLNFGLLHHLVEVYGDDRLQQRMLKYTASVESFRKQTTIKVFWKASPATRKCPKIPTELRESLTQISFKHGNLDPTTTTLNDIEIYRQDLAQEYSFPDFTIILAHIEKGCVATIWLVPPSLAAKLADELKRGNVSFLEQHNILELKIQESTVYHSEAAQTTDGATGGHSQTEGSVPEISFSDLEIGDELGEGASGVVYRGHWKSRDMDVAIKRVPGKINKTEIEILNKLKHPCIIQFHGVVVDRPGPPEYWIITELAEGGSLYDLIHKKNYQPSQEESLRWAEQIAQGMKYLHEEKTMHRDLKSSNVLLTGKGNIKICDFGGAKHFDHTTKLTQTGTYRWMAPEVMKGEPVSLSSDVFSYGMLLYEILTGELPFADAKTDMVVINKLMSGEVPLIPASMESYMAKTLKQCWNANPKARPSFHDILEILPNRGHATGQQQITIREIQWRTGKATPESMERGAAVSHGKMAYFNSGGSTSVYSYDSQGQLWQELPDCHSRNSALVMAKDKLTTVGGWQDGRPTNSLASLTGEGRHSKWVELFPRMPTARYDLAAVCRGRNVIAAGGLGGGGRRLSTVEILDTDLRQWSSAASLPHPMVRASITVCGDLLYLLGGWDQNGRTLSVLTSSITDLLHQQQETANQPAVWRRAADAPYYVSTAVSVGGQLLAIGGRDEAWKDTSAIVAYDPTSDSWQDMGHMTTPRWLPLVALLPSNELIVAGGYGGKKKVEIGNVV